MSVLPVLFWVLLILTLLGLWVPGWPAQWRYVPLAVLLIILGLRVFPVNWS